MADSPQFGELVGCAGVWFFLFLFGFSLEMRVTSKFQWGCFVFSVLHISICFYLFFFLDEKEPTPKGLKVLLEKSEQKLVVAIVIE
jgi:dolichyl-phosphate-mannose--protein O-mannosyl transferase